MTLGEDRQTDKQMVKWAAGAAGPQPISQPWRLSTGTQSAEPEKGSSKTIQDAMESFSEILSFNTFYQE